MSRVKRYRAYGTVEGSKYLGEIEARSREEAMQKAWELDSVSVGLCHHCNRQCEDAQVVEIYVEVDDENN